MEETGGSESLMDKIKPPRLEDAGLEDCALPPEAINEAFLKAASAVRSFDTDSEDEDPWEDGAVSSPSKGCGAVKNGGLTKAPGDPAMAGGDTEVEVGETGMYGLRIGNLGKKLGSGRDGVEEEEEKGEDKPTDIS